MATPGFKIPSPWDTRSCPSFDGKTAESLMKYIKNCKMIIKGGGITDDKEKKEIVSRYLSIKTAGEWEGMSGYTTGNFDDWIIQIEQLFPEIKTMEVGSLLELDKICQEYQKVKKSERGKIERLNLSFAHEAKKLSMPPSLVTNIALVDKYLSCFDSQFVTEISFMIAQTVYWDSSATTGGNPGPQQNVPVGPQGVERPEETIPLPALMELVSKLSKVNNLRTVASAHLAVQESMMVNSSMGASSGSSTSSEMVKLRADLSDQMDTFASDIAKLKDSQELIEKWANSSLQRFEEKTSYSFQKLEESIKQMNQSLRGPAPHQEISQAGQSSNRYGQDRGFKSQSQDQPNRDCYYCYLTGHMVRDCPYKREHIDQGRILIENGRMKLGDGSPFPGYPESKSQKQRVDDYYGNKQVPGAPQVLVQSYSQPRLDVITTFHVGIDNLWEVYDTKSDEIRTAEVQQYIRSNQPRNDYAPVSTYQAQVLPQYGGQVQTYSPSYQQFQQSQYQIPNFPINQPVQAVPNMQIDGMNISQLVQVMKALKMAENDSPSVQAQLAQTRGGARNSGPDPQNF
ncbi:hypothetical protein B0H13DRAFT_2351036 [Mycena leptocephala]|nr:hypothetical protein B0H13DRAFT_2351036 [Mycena leptocephala]